MKLEKGTEIEVCNVIVNPELRTKSKNSGFVNSNIRSHRREIGVSGSGSIVTEEACALDGTICDRCRRIYNFGIPGAVAQCECNGREVN